MLLSATLCIALTSCSATAEQRGFTIEDALARSFVDGSVVDMRREELIYQYIPSFESSHKTFPFHQWSILRRARSRIMAQSVSGGHPRPLFAHEVEAGYSLVNSSKAVSPNGDFLLVSRLSDTTSQIGIVELETSDVEFVDGVTIDPGDKVSWVSATKFVFVGAEADIPGDAAVDAAREIAARRERSWIGEASATVIPNEQNGIAEQSLCARQLVLFDTLNGSAEQIVRAGVLSYQVSSSGNYVSAFTVNCTSKTENTVHLTIIDVRSKATRIIKTSFGDHLAIRTWSPVSDEFLFAVPGNGRAVLLKVFSGDTDTIRTVPSSKIEFWGGSYEERGRNIRRIPTASWLGGNVVFLGSANKKRRDWYIERGDQVEALTADLDTVPRIPIGRSTDSIYFVDQGNVYKVTEDGQTYNLTADEQLAYDVCRVANLDADRQFGNRIDDIRNVPFCAATESQKRISFLDENQQLSLTYEVGATAEVLSANESGLTFIENKVGVGSSLHYCNLAGLCRSLLVFNEHLAAVLPRPNPVPIGHDGNSGEELTSWLFLPPENIRQGRRAPLVAIVYGERVFSRSEPKNRAARDIWTLRPLSPSVVELFTGSGFAVLLVSLPIDTDGNPIDQFPRPMLSALAALEQREDVSVDNTALVGVSYGAYTALSLATRLTTFDAVIVQSTVSNLTSAYGQFTPADTAALKSGLSSGPSFAEGGQWRLGAAPWEESERYIHNSPLFHLDGINAPVLLIHGDLDYTPVAQSEEVYTALTRMGKPVEFVRYWGEGHGIVQPQNQIDMWYRVFAFLDRAGLSPNQSE